MFCLRFKTRIYPRKSFLDALVSSSSSHRGYVVIFLRNYIVGRSRLTAGLPQEYSGTRLGVKLLIIIRHASLQCSQL